MSSPILLILGAGPNIGSGVAKAFAGKGYKVASAARNDHLNGRSSLFVPVDLNKPETVPSVFDTVKKELGSPPSVVVYNAAFLAMDDAKDPLSTFTLENAEKTLSVNTTSALVALHQSVLGFRSLPVNASKTFIYTGNVLNVLTIPIGFTFGVGKSATAAAIRALVDTKLYEKDGIQFYYADERGEGGGPVPVPDSSVAGEEYVKLAERKDQGPWLYTYVKGLGYTEF